MLSSNIWARRAGELVGLGLLTIVFCVYTIPLLVSFLLALAVTAILHFAKDDYANLMVALSFVFTLLCVEILFRTLPVASAPQYYRPEEVLVQEGEKKHDLRYKANKSLLGFKTPYGDLGALAPQKDLAESRVVDFITDNLGHRNRAPYAQQKYIVFGDSFVVGSGSSQESTISENLTLDFVLPTYNAGFPGDPFHYVAKVKEMRKLVGPTFEGIMLIFEGNDFKCDQDSPPSIPISRFESALQFVPDIIQKLDSYRFFFGLTRRALFSFEPRHSSELVKIYNVGEKPMAFHNSYKIVTERTKTCWHWVRIVEPLKEVASSIRLIVFVPDKYRVYHDFIENSGAPLLTLQSDFFRKAASELGIQYLDLTEPLTKRSAELLKEGKYTWWRDDTHWNPEGILIGAAEIANILKHDTAQKALSKKGKE